MATLNSFCPMLGSEIDIYMHANKDLSMYISNFVIRGRIVGVHMHGIGLGDWLLAWSSGQQVPSAKYTHPDYNYVGPGTINAASFAADVDMYLYYCWVPGNIEIAVYHATKSMNNTAPANLTSIAINGMPATLPMIKTAKLLDSDVMGYPATNTAFSEAPCSNPTCRKMNDVGNPAVKNCWNCCSKL